MMKELEAGFRAFDLIQRSIDNWVQKLGIV